jgi:hypothetical protein
MKFSKKLKKKAHFDEISVFYHFLTSGGNYQFKPILSPQFFWFFVALKTSNREV